MNFAKKRFTILELMVVIAIIAILFSMFFPSYLRAKNSAYVAACASNQKQLYAPHFSYARDNNWNPVSVNTSGYYWEGDKRGDPVD